MVTKQTILEIPPNLLRNPQNAFFEDPHPQTL